MLNKLLYVAGLALAFILGSLTAARVSTAAGESDEPDTVPAAYVIACASVAQPQTLQPYYEAAVPLAEAAGLQMVASGVSDSTVQVLEGSWPYGGGVLIEKYTSMDKLLAFWHSADYQAARKLREGRVDVDLIVAVEAVP